jgi:hypothetical protein
VKRRFFRPLVPASCGAERSKLNTLGGLPSGGPPFFCPRVGVISIRVLIFGKSSNVRSY